MVQRETPKFTGITTYRDPLGRFSIRHPSDWRVFDIREGVPQTRGKPRKARTAAAKRATEENPLPVREGIGFAPDPDDLKTAFTVWASPLGQSVVAEDLAELREGVDEGLQLLEGCEIEHSEEDVLSNLIKFERIYTFHEQGAARKRKQWLLYVDTWLICLTWQGSSPELYQHWFAMANYSFLTFELPTELWFATDRTLSSTRGGASAKVEEASGRSE